MPTAIVFPEENRVELMDYTPEPPEAGEMLVRTRYSGVSQGTELWALGGHREELTFPTIPGYQSIGVIEQLGPDVEGYEVGQRVLFHRSRPATGWTETWMAGHVSLATAPIDNDPAPLVLDGEIDPVAASILAMAAVSHRGVSMLDIKLGDVAVVLGQGLIGQTAAQLARAAGATVIACDTVARRLELSAEHSADRVVNVAEQDLLETVLSLRPNGVDIVIDTTGRADLFDTWVDLLRVEGQVLMQGYYPDPISFDFFRTHLKRPKIAIACGIGDTRACLELLHHGRLSLRPLVTHLVSIDEAPEIYRAMARRDPSILGAVFDWEGTA